MSRGRPCLFEWSGKKHTHFCEVRGSFHNHPSWHICECGKTLRADEAFIGDDLDEDLDSSGALHWVYDA